MTQDQLKLLHLLCYNCNVLPLKESLFQLGLCVSTLSAGVANVPAPYGLPPFTFVISNMPLPDS